MSDGRKPSAGGISGDADLAAALAGLERVSRDRFAEDGALYFFGAMPRALLLRAAAYKMQERGLGGLLAPTRRRLSGRNRARSSASAGSETAHPLIHSLNLPIAWAAKKRLLGLA